MSEDAPLSDDVAELNREAQRAVDRVIAARVELDAAIANVNETRTKIADGSAAAVAFIDNYMNPTVPNPPPVAPEVAAEPPAEEPPVFTTVDDADVALENSSGGEADVAPIFDVIVPEAEAAAPADVEPPAE